MALLIAGFAHAQDQGPPIRHADYCSDIDETIERISNRSTERTQVLQEAVNSRIKQIAAFRVRRDADSDIVRQEWDDAITQLVSNLEGIAETNEQITAIAEFQFQVSELTDRHRKQVDDLLSGVRAVIDQDFENYTLGLSDGASEVATEISGSLASARQMCLEGVSGPDVRRSLQVKLSSTQNFFETLIDAAETRKEVLEEHAVQYIQDMKQLSDQYRESFDKLRNELLTYF